MTKARVVDIIGTSNAILHSSGMKLFEVIQHELEMGKEIELSFEGVKHLTTGFCNASIGNLYNIFQDKFGKTLRIIDVPKESDWQDKIDCSIQLVKNPAKSELVDKAILRLLHG